MEQGTNHLLDVCKALFKWKRPILIFTIVATISTVVVSLCLPNYYEASTVFYATSPDLQSPAAIFNEKNTLKFFGNGDDQDRLIQAANSNDLFDFMVEKFDLYQHYDINPNSQKAPYKLRQKFYKHFNVIKNERDAIILSVEDKNPEIAASMANVARDKINITVNGLLRNTLNTVVQTYKKEIESKERSLKNIADSLVILREQYNIFDAAEQSSVIGQKLPILKAQLASANAKMTYFRNNNLQDSIQKTSILVLGLEQQIKAFTQGNNQSSLSLGISKIGQLTQHEESVSEELDLDKSKLRKYEAALAVQKPALLVQDHAIVPVIKSRPKRSLIIIGVAILSFFLAVLAVLLIEYNREIDWKSIVNTK